MSERHPIRDPLDSTLVTSQRAFIAPWVWNNFFRVGLKKLVIKNGLADHAFAYDLLVNSALCTENLEAIDISGPAFKDLYLAITSMPVKKLALEPYRLFDDQAVELMIRNLDLVELELRCSSLPCIFRRKQGASRRNHDFLQTLATTCPNLTKISMSCSCRMSCNVAQEMLLIIFSMGRPLQIHIATSSAVIECIFSRLPATWNAEFTLVGDRSETTRMMPARGVLIRRVDIKRAQGIDVTSLRNFYELREVKLEVMDRAEIALETIPLAKVNILRIGGSPYAARAREHLYYNLEYDFLFRAVAVAPMLRKVGIVNCRIDRVEICAIIRHLGSRLTHFEMSMLGQIECPQQRVLDVMNTMIEFCPCIETFIITDSIHRDEARRLIFGPETCEHYKFLYTRLSHARDLLYERSPFLDPGPLTMAIKSLHPSANSVSFAGYYS